jgi:hypothetical protein
MAVAQPSASTSTQTCSTDSRPAVKRSNGTLSTRPGRILAAIPRSASHTSPRSAVGTGGLLGVVAAEQLSR